MEEIGFNLIEETETPLEKLNNSLIMYNESVLITDKRLYYANKYGFQKEPSKEKIILSKDIVGIQLITKSKFWQWVYVLASTIIIVTLILSSFRLWRAEAMAYNADKEAKAGIADAFMRAMPMFGGSYTSARDLIEYRPTDFKSFVTEMVKQEDFWKTGTGILLIYWALSIIIGTIFLIFKKTKILEIETRGTNFVSNKIKINVSKIKPDEVESFKQAVYKAIESNDN